MKRVLLSTVLSAAVALMVAVSPAAAGGKHGKGGKSQGINASVSVLTGKGGLLGTVLGTLRGHNGVGVNAKVTTGRGGILGAILGGR